MQIKQGIPVSPGIAISKVVVIDAEDIPVPRHTVSRSKVGAEHKRLDGAIDESLVDLTQQREQAAAKLGPELARIFDFHIGMLKDKQLVGQFNRMIDDESVTAEYSVYAVMRKQADMFRQMESSYFRDRVKDVFDLERRILSHLIEHAREELDHLVEPVVVVAHDLTPSQTAALDKTRIKALVTDAGGATSHTAILAHALGIPAIVGLGNITQQVNTGDMIIIDGYRGVVVIAPDAAELMQYRSELSRRQQLVPADRDSVAVTPAITTDGIEITVWANIEFPYEIEAAVTRGATGVGLYRTEFVFLSSTTEPSEDEQYEQYRQAVQNMNGLPITFRTLDLGADKLMTTAKDYEHTERNPFLGCRSIRLCLQNLPLFKTQLRAILRASVEGPIRIMFPLISNIMELRQAKMILSDVCEDLEEQGVAYRQNIPVGIMIEVPSAALQARTLARECDFFSIGTNDLIQYTVAVDRGNERIASLYSGAHPAVLYLIKEVVRAAKRANIELSICGEMAGEPEYVMLLLGMGMTRFSVTPPAVGDVKKIVRAASVQACQKIARKVSVFDTDREVLNYLRKEVRKTVPDVFEQRAMDY